MRAWTPRGGSGEQSLDFESFLKRLFRSGAIEVHLPGGKRLVLGDGGEPTVIVRVTDNLTLAKILAAPSLGVGEAYMDGRLVFEKGSIRDLLELATRNGSVSPTGKRPGRLRRTWSAVVAEHNARNDARRNVAHHYDLSADLYRAFLDPDMQYSCAYFERPDMSLEAAQAAKKRHIFAKLDITEGARVLDIGCGWGGMALSLAKAGAIVDGVTLSQEQLAIATARAEAAGLANRARFSLTDYRDVSGTYDRIVSVGMFEHVGRLNYQAYFDTIAERLTDDGVALIHSIGRKGPPSTTDKFTAKYIFPGGYIPSLSEVMPSIERAGLWVTDMEILRLHYARTLELWLERFEARRADMAALYDERFCRMWEFYLAGAEMGFRYGTHMNFQVQLTKKVAALPITRDYMGEAERRLEQREKAAA